MTLRKRKTAYEYRGNRRRNLAIEQAEALRPDSRAAKAQRAVPRINKAVSKSRPVPGLKKGAGTAKTLNGNSPITSRGLARRRLK